MGDMPSRSPGHRIASGSSDQTVRLWNADPATDQRPAHRSH